MFITWTVLAHAQGLWLLLPLILVIGLVRANRSLQVLWLIIPPALAKAGLALLARAIDMPAEIAGLLEYVAFGPLIIGLAVILLLGEKLGHCRKPMAWGLALLILTSAGIMGSVAYGYSEQFRQGLIFLGIVDSTVLLAMTLTAWCCRKRYTGLRFFLWLILWTAVCCLGTMSLYFVITLFTNDWGDRAAEMFMQLIVTSLILGGVLLLIQMPYVLLGMFNRFYRPRFLGLLGLSRGHDQDPSPVADPETTES